MRRPREQHGMTGTPIYQAWQNMLARSTPGSAMQRYVPSYQGVGRSQRWESFTGFVEDMGGSHFPGACLARYGDTGDYTPENCRWLTKADNARDRTKLFTSDGRPGVEAARANGVPQGTFAGRVARGLSVDEAAGVAS